jgi:diacylglycerol kinase (ATP)
LKLAAITLKDAWARERALPRLFEQHLAAGSDFELYVADSADDIATAARSAAEFCDIVVAAGGDGTVANVATGIFGSGSALAILPLGSTNITAKSLGIPADPVAAIKLLAGDHALRSIDVGICRDRCFLHMAGVGFDAEIFLKASQVWKRRVGWLAYLPPAIAAVRSAPADIQVTVDGTHKRHRSPLVLVANGGSIITPRLRLLPDIANDDGWLDVLIFTCATQAEVFSTLGSVCAGRAHHSRFVTWLRGRQVRIESEPHLWVELDGDPIAQTPQDFMLVPNGIEVVTRREYAD